MPKLPATRKNIYAVADRLAAKKGEPERVSAAEVRREIVDINGRVERFHGEWMIRATGKLPDVLTRSFEAIAAAYRRETGSDRGRGAVPVPSAPLVPPAAETSGAPRRRGRPPKAAKASAHPRGSFMAMHAARKSKPPKIPNARPEHLGPHVRKSRKGTSRRRHPALTREERRARQGDAAKLYGRLAPKAGRAALPPRKKVRRSDWENADNPDMAKDVAALLRDKGHALRYFEIHDHLVRHRGWRPVPKPAYVIPLGLTGSRIGSCGKGFVWFDYEDPPYRSLMPRYKAVDSDQSSVNKLGEIVWTEALEAMRKARRALRPSEIGQRLADMQLNFTDCWLRQRLRRELEKPDGLVERTADGGYAIKKKKPPARGGRR